MQESDLAPKNRAILQIKSTNLLAIFPINFARPLAITQVFNHYIFICLDHFLGLNVAVVTLSSPTGFVVDLVRINLLILLGHQELFYSTTPPVS